MKSIALFSICTMAVLGLCGGIVAEPAALVHLATVRPGALRPQITAYGAVTADPGGLTTVAIPRDGTIAAVSVRPGEMVKPGDAIAIVDTAPAAAAQYAQAKSAFDFAQKDLDHTRALFGEQLATRSQLASVEKSYADARAAYRQQNMIGAGQSREVLRASVPGVVTTVSVSPGDRIAANAVLAVIADRDRLVIDLGLEPNAAASVPAGAPVRLLSPQNGTIDFRSKIASVAAMMDPQSRLVNAVVEVPKDIAPHLILSMTLEADIDLPARKGLVIPKSALMADEQGTYVFIVKSGRARRRAVKIAFETSKQALVTDGLAAREQVVAAGASGVQDGMAVRTK